MNTPRDLKRVVVIMPAYHAESTLARTMRDVPMDVVSQVILVDDSSTDRTAEISRELGLTTYEHERNTGYGGCQKTCYKHALAAGADIVVMIHPDYQYDARVIPAMVTLLRLDICDVVFGSRIRSRAEAIQSGMPWWKYIANRTLTAFENMAFGQNLGECHTGLRAYTREVLETIPFHENSDDFVFDSQVLAQTVHFGFKIGDVPVPVRYFEEASSINFRRSVTYGLSTLGVVARFWLQRLGWSRVPWLNSAAPDGAARDGAVPSSGADGAPPPRE